MEMDQVLSQEGDSNRATQELYHDGATGLSEADGVLLIMELMEDSLPPAVDDDVVDGLSHVIQSLEAEILRGGAATVPKDDGECFTVPPSEDNCMIEEMLMADLDGYGGGASMSMGYWPEVPPVGGWYLYTEGGEGTIVGYEARDQQYYSADHQGCVEQVYSPLWE
uniref:Uncharacterized protein n=1 Tax=Avena sativa TaxID=4498 RepID=A0ACD5YZZ4_AVESA